MLNIIPDIHVIQSQLKMDVRMNQNKRNCQVTAVRK
jgi:hypothetical protein